MSITAFYTYQDGQLEETHTDILKEITTPGAIYTRCQLMVINPLNENFTPEEQGKIVVELSKVIAQRQ